MYCLTNHIIMEQIVIACYKPKPGKAGALKELMKTHVPRLKAEGLVTSRQSIVMEAKDGTIIEVFEWLSAEAIASAHTNPNVLKMWGEYAEVCDYVAPNSVAECAVTFAGFKPLN